MARLFLMLAALAAMAALAPAADAQRGEMRTYWERIDRAYDARDWNGVIRNARRMRTHEDWRELPARVRWPILTREGEALGRIGEYQRARLRLMDALQLTRGADRGGPLFWLFVIEASVGDWSNAAQRLIEIQQVLPAQLDDFSYHTLNRVIIGLQETGEDHLYEAILTLMVTEYQPEETTTHLDGMVLRYVEILVGHGELSAALGQAERVLYGELRLQLRSSALYAPLWSDPHFDRLTDPVAGEQAALARAQAEAASDRRRMGPIYDQVNALMALGRLDEARALAETALARFSNGRRFDDGEAWAAWLMDSAARILYAQNRVQEADAWMVRAADLPENGGPNVSQVMNYATMLSYQGRQEDALMLLRQLEEGELPHPDLMWIWSLQACAQHRLGRPDARDRRLGQLRKDWSANAPAYQRALVCLGDVEAAAALLVARLDDPQLRAEALAAVQDRPLLISAEAMPLAAELEAGFRALRQRPEVLAAIAEHGRIERVELRQSHLGAF